MKNQTDVYKLEADEIDNYLCSIAGEIFDQSNIEHLTPQKLGIVRINLITRRKEDDVVKNNFKELDNRLKELIGIEVC